MESQRYNTSLLYTGQTGGYSKKRLSKHSPKKKYSPPDIDNSTSMAKLFKANRLLRAELDEVKSKLKEVTSQLDYETKKNKLRDI